MKLGEINNQTEMYDKSEVDLIISALPTGGDMLKSVYDTNDDGIVNQADVITNQGDLATLDSVDTAQITNGAVENTKLAQMNANTVKGRLSGNGTPQDIAMADLPISTATQTALNGKQNILSEGAFVNGDKTKLDGIEAGAEVNTVDSVNGRTGAITGLAEDNEVVKLTGNQTIAGVKTFSSSPIVPTPTTDMQVATKKYVDDKSLGKVRARSTTGTSCTSGVFTKITLGTEDFDILSEFDNVTNFRFTASVSGYYQVTLIGEWAGWTGTSAPYLTLYVNGARSSYELRNTVSSATKFIYTDTIFLSSTHYLEMYARQDTGSTQTIFGKMNVNRMA